MTRFSFWKCISLGNERVSPAIESAWAASGITQDDIAREMSRPDAARQALIDKAIAKAKVFAKTEKKWKVFYAALPSDWQARLDQAFADARHGTEEAERKFKEDFMTLPPAGQKELMSPKTSPPDLFDYFNQSTGRRKRRSPMPNGKRRKSSVRTLSGRRTGRVELNHRSYVDIVCEAR